MAGSNLRFAVKIDFSVSENQQKAQYAMHQAQKVLDNCVLKDSNRYCPEDSSMLKKSAIISTVLGSGRVIWSTPYAVAQYYGMPNKSKQKNPNAAMKWFEVAKSKKSKQWEGIVYDEYIKNFK